MCRGVAHWIENPVRIAAVRLILRNVIENVGVALAVIALGSLCLFSLTPYILGIWDGIDSIRERRAMRRRGYRREPVHWPTSMGQQFGFPYTYVREDGEDENGDAGEDDYAGTRHERAGRREGQHADHESRYGEAHRALRAAWKDIIRLRGAECMEHECLMPSRGIEAGASWDSWDLAHDHERGGKFDYLGPAHRICNQAEALRRGVTWEGAPSLPDLLDQASDKATHPWSSEAQVEDSWGDEGEFWDAAGGEGRHYPWSALDGREVSEPERRVESDPWAAPGYSNDDEPPF